MLGDGDASERDRARRSRNAESFREYLEDFRAEAGMARDFALPPIAVAVLWSAFSITGALFAIHADPDDGAPWRADPDDADDVAPSGDAGDDRPDGAA